MEKIRKEGAGSGRNFQLQCKPCEGEREAWKVGQEKS
jgi:hypothetical protein